MLIHLISFNGKFMDKILYIIETNFAFFEKIRGEYI